MDNYVAETLAGSQPGTRPSHEWMQHVIALLDAAVSQLHAWQARKVRAYVDDHIGGPVAVADLSALFRLNEAHFSRVFRRTFGSSPHAYVIRRRVELAAQYMLQTRESLSDIALRCGFSDQPHLCRHFRQVTGHTPAAWRRTHSMADDTLKDLDRLR